MVEQDTKQEKQKAKIAVIRIRGDVGRSADVRKTFELLRLYRKNYCVVVPNSGGVMGMLFKVKDFTTFGEIDKETFAKLLQSRGKIVGDKPLTEAYLKDKAKMDFKQFTDAFFDFKIELKSVPGVKQFFRLHPPIGGFERAGIKQHFAVGGALGYRRKDINKLILKMIK